MDITGEERELLKVLKAYRRLPIRGDSRCYNINIRVTDTLYLALKQEAIEKHMSLSHLFREMAIIYMDVMEGQKECQN